jgi:hypothetical protein
MYHLESLKKNGFYDVPKLWISSVAIKLARDIGNKFTTSIKMGFYGVPKLQISYAQIKLTRNNGKQFTTTALFLSSLS